MIAVALYVVAVPLPLHGYSGFVVFALLLSSGCLSVIAGRRRWPWLILTVLVAATACLLIRALAM
jgi:hypothetical protein